jgi:surface protein
MATLCNDLLFELIRNLAMNGLTQRILWMRQSVDPDGDGDVARFIRGLSMPLVMDIEMTEDQQTFLIPFHQARVVNFLVLWGDGTQEVYNSDTWVHKYVVHKYCDPGTYIVRLYRIDGTDSGLDHLGFGGAPVTDNWWRPLRSLRTLGTLGIRSLSACFLGAKDFNLPLGHLDTSSITDLAYMFSGAESFNQPIGRWDVSNVTNIKSMFLGASKFNQNIGTWDVSKVQNMESMFSYASAFNQDVSHWNVESLTNMKNMFHWATNFNQNLEAWDQQRAEIEGNVSASSSQPDR